MTYTELIETVSIVLETDKINKTGLALEYKLDESVYDKLYLDLFYKTTTVSTEFIVPTDFEVELGGILVKIKKV